MMSRPVSPFASAVLAASCLWGSEANSQAPQLSKSPENTQSFWVQFADGKRTKYEMSGGYSVKSGQALWVPYNGTTRLGIVRSDADRSLQNPGLQPPPLLPRIEPLAAPQVYENNEGALLVPPRAPGIQEESTPEHVTAKILYSGPIDLREELRATAADTFSSVARSWFERTPDIPTLQLKVEIANDRREASTHFNTRPDQPLDIVIEITGKPEELTRLVRREIALVVAHCCHGDEVPQWFGEGLSTSTEPNEWQNYYQQTYSHTVRTRRLYIPITALLMRTDTTLAAESELFSARCHQVLRFLMARAPFNSEDEQRRYVAKFVSEVIATGGTLAAYDTALSRYYGILNVAELERELHASKAGALP